MSGGAPQSEPGPTYETLGGEGAAAATTGYPGNVTPFSDEEVFDGTLQSVLYGYQVAGFRWRSGEVELFSETFRQPPMSPVPLPTFISKLGVGEALASYGIGHGMAVEQVLGRAADLPPWVTILLYGGLTFGASYFGMQRIKLERQQENIDAGRAGARAAGAEESVREGEYAAV